MLASCSTKLSRPRFCQLGLTVTSYSEVGTARSRERAGEMTNDAWFEFVSIPTGRMECRSAVYSGCLPPAVSGRADCHCNEPSEGVHVTRSTASRRSWPPDVDRTLCYNSEVYIT